MKSFLYFCLCLFFSNSSFALKGKVFAKDSARKNLMFSIDSQINNKDGIEDREVLFTDDSGNVAVIEKIKRKGTNIFQYSTKYPIQKEEGHLKVEKDKISFSYTKNGKTKTAEENLTDNFVVGLSIVPYIQSNWDKFVSEKDLDIRYGVLHRRETVGFTFVRKPKLEKDERFYVAKMSPTSFFIKALVDPVYFYFNKETKELSHYIGRAKPRVKTGKKWEPLDAEVVYYY